MEWLNIWGMIFIVVIMIPNIIFAHKYKDGFGNAHISRIIICTEQIGSSKNHFDASFGKS